MTAVGQAYAYVFSDSRIRTVSKFRTVVFFKQRYLAIDISYDSNGPGLRSTCFPIHVNRAQSRPTCFPIYVNKEEEEWRCHGHPRPVLTR